MKKLNNIIGILVVVMVFAAGIYGYIIGYTAAVLNAELVTVTESGYEIRFGNQIHRYN